MAKITHVKKAQQRYETKPVLDEHGDPIKIALTDKRTGLPRKTKHGRPVTITKTVRDLERPLPPLTCDYPACPVEGKVIAVGTPYKHISPRSGPFGGRQLNRHESCPTWNVWDYSDSIDARVAQVQNDGEAIIAGIEDEESFDAAIEECKGLAEELWQEKEENLQNLPDSLQETGEFYERVQALEEWVDGFDNVDKPDYPEAAGTVAKWFVVGPDAQSLDEEGFETEDEAKDELETWLRNHPDEDEDDWEIEEHEVDVDEPEVDEDELNEWIDAAQEALREALNGFEG